MTDPISIGIVLGTIISFVGLGFGALMYASGAKQWRKSMKELQNSYDKMLSQKKSSEVRVGKIGENMAPFLTDWPYDPNNFRFLGNPVDGIQINQDSIILIEIKTGNSRLSKTQKRAKQLVREGKVYFETFRISDDGCTLKRAEKICKL